MNIGLDIDGVLINQEKFQLEKGIKYFKKLYIKDYYEKHKVKLKYSDVEILDLVTGTQFNKKEKLTSKHYIEINPNGYGICEIFNCSEKLQEKFWYKYMIPYALFMPFRKDASRIIQKLYDEGNKIFPITARAKANENNFIGKLQRSILVFKLKVNKIPYEKISYCSYKGEDELEDKANACVENKIDLMIEDKKSIAKRIEEKTTTQTFLFVTKNNADIESKNILRFVNFGELYSGIRKYQEEEQFTLLNREEKSKLTTLERENYYKAFRQFNTKYIYDKEIIDKRTKKQNNVIKYGKYLFDLFVKHNTINSERIPKESGIIITTNHRDMLDIPLLMRVIGPRGYHPILKSEFLDTKAESLLTDMNCLFVNRNDKSIREQTRITAAKLLLSGKNVIICPEGTRNKTDNPLLDFDYGAVSIAQNSGRKIYPCAIYRTHNYKTINFGSPIKVGAEDDLKELNETLYNKTLQLLEECRLAEENKEFEIPADSKEKVKSLIKRRLKN